MSKSKASDAVVIRKLIAAQGPETLRRFLEQLPTARKEFDLATPTGWLSLEAESEIFRAAAAVLYPDDPNALETLASQVSKIQFSGLYRAFLQIASPEFIVKHLSSIWSTFYDRGAAQVTNFTGKSGTLRVLNFPDLTATQRQYLCGFIRGVLELAHAKEVHVAHNGTHPEAWEWDIRWK